MIFLTGTAYGCPGLSACIYVGVGVPDDPSAGFDLDGQIRPHTELPPVGGWDVEDAIPYENH